MPCVLRLEGGAGLGGREGKEGERAQVKSCSGSAHESDGRGCSVVEEHTKESCPLAGEERENSHSEREHSEEHYFLFPFLFLFLFFPL